MQVSLGNETNFGKQASLVLGHPYCTFNLGLIFLIQVSLGNETIFGKPASLVLDNPYFTFKLDLCYSIKLSEMLFGFDINCTRKVDLL